MEHPSHLVLDRSRANFNFESWRLSHAPESPQVEHLPCPTFLPPICDTDYVHARNTALFNSLITLPAGNFLFLEDDGVEGSSVLYQIATEANSVQFHKRYSKSFR